MRNYLRAYVQRAADQPDNAGTPIRFVASTQGVKRDGKDLDAQRWNLENYRKNPVFLWAHDYMGRTLPIGRAEASLDGAQLIADVTFDQSDDFAKQVEGKYRRGYMSAVSVGWEEGKAGYDLLDISAVPVPGDPDALMERQIRNVSESDDWRETSADMVDLFLDITPRPDAERKTRYARLARKYERAGKTPPEYRTAAQVVVLGADELAGLFFHDEQFTMSISAAADMLRSGAVLNARNRGDLEQAVALINGVLERASKEKTDGTNESESETERALHKVLEALKTK